MSIKDVSSINLN